MSLFNILIIILILMMIGVFPAWPHAANFGYEPISVIVLIILILLVYKLLK